MKKFLIIGNMNAVTYKEVFPLIKENKLWLGVSSFNKGMYFLVDDDFVYADSYKFEREIDGKKVSRVSSICWFTNLDHKRRHEEVILYKKYNEEEYPKYDNYDAINVDKVCDIPLDYNGAMGVPVSFMDKYCPEQFEIIGLGIANLGLSVGVKPYKPEHKKYRKEVQKRGAVDGDLYLMNGDEVKVPYARMLIRLKR